MSVARGRAGLGAGAARGAEGCGTDSHGSSVSSGASQRQDGKLEPVNPVKSHFEVLLPARWETAWARCSAVSSAPSVQGGFRAPVAV